MVSYLPHFGWEGDKSPPKTFYRGGGGSRTELHKAIGPHLPSPKPLYHCLTAPVGIFSE